LARYLFEKLRLKNLVANFVVTNVNSSAFIEYKGSMKVQAKYYREIEYVLVSELPPRQQASLKNFTEAEYIKILIDGQITGPCLQYKQYEEWYAAVFVPQAGESPTSKPLPVKDLAWGKL